MPVAAAQQYMADVTDEGYALEHGGQADIEAHVAIQDMTEFVGDDPL